LARGGEFSAQWARETKRDENIGQQIINWGGPWMMAGDAVGTGQEGSIEELGSLRK
jgi:hypothetical protein